MCDLNVQNIQNWLFIPIINTKQANRITLNLTFTIRECEQFPIKQVVKNCKEKFELYYEEISDNEIGKQELDADSNQTLSFFQNKIKRLRFRDTFVSDTGLRYYNSFVDRQQQHTRLPDSSSINVELREIPLMTTTTTTSNSDSFIRFAIRDSGACISLLSVEVSYLTCSAFTKHGIYFAETSTGRDLTDLIQVNGKCPLNSISSSSNQMPKAICTAKGEWLITDQSLSTRCLCMPGFEFINDECVPCRPGYFKQAASNDQKCMSCPLKSWSFKDASSKCECLNEFYRENESDHSSHCKQIQTITFKNINLNYLNEEKLNISIDRSSLDLSPSIRTEIKCFVCQNKSATNCNTNCLISSVSSEWIVLLISKTNSEQNVKLVITQKMNQLILIKSDLFINLNQMKHTSNKQSINSGTILLNLNQDYLKSSIKCEIFQDISAKNNANSPICSNMTIDLITELERIYSRYNLVERIKAAEHAQLKIYALLLINNNNNNNDYQLIPNESKSSSSYYVQLRSIENLNLKHIISSKNNSNIPILICNVFEIESIKLEINFKPVSFSNYEEEDNNNNNDETNSLDMFTIEIKLSNHCFKREINTDLKEAQKLENYQHNSTNFKVHVILPVLLSFFLVSTLIVIALFIRR